MTRARFAKSLQSCVPGSIEKRTGWNIDVMIDRLLVKEWWKISPKAFLFGKKYTPARNSVKNQVAKYARKELDLLFVSFIRNLFRNDEFYKKKKHETEMKVNDSFNWGLIWPWEGLTLWSDLLFSAWEHQCGSDLRIIMIERGSPLYLLFFPPLVNKPLWRKEATHEKQKKKRGRFFRVMSRGILATPWTLSAAVLQVAKAHDRVGGCPFQLPTKQSGAPDLCGSAFEAAPICGACIHHGAYLLGSEVVLSERQKAEMIPPHLRSLVALGTAWIMLEFCLDFAWSSFHANTASGGRLRHGNNVHFLWNVFYRPKRFFCWFCVTQRLNGKSIIHWFWSHGKEATRIRQKHTWTVKILLCFFERSIVLGKFFMELAKCTTPS